MNLFDYIKFQSMDITSVEELWTLPTALIDLIWDDEHSSAPSDCPTSSKVAFIAWMHQISNNPRKRFLIKLNEYYKKNNTDESL